MGGILQVVGQLDDKDGASSLDLEDLASQTQVQVNEIVAAVTERLQQVERHLHAEHDDSVLQDTCKEVENEIAAFRSGLQLVQHLQEGWERHRIDAMASVLQDVLNTSSEMLRELRGAVSNDMASQQSKMAALRADLHKQCIRAEATETSHAGLMKTLSEVVQWHRQELQECKQELKESQAKVDAMANDLALTNASACTLSEQKQQAEASLNACREYIAYLQEAEEQDESQVESYKSVHEHVLMESQSQMDILKAALEASDHQMQAAQRQIAAQVDEVAVLQAEQEALAAVIQQQREVIAEQSAQSDKDRETIATLEVCMHSAIEEMELMCSASTSAMQSLRDTSRPTIAAELMSTQQQLTDLRCFVQKSIIHMQDTKRLLYHHMEDTDELSLQNEVQNLSAELLHSRQSCDGWREKHHVQVKEADRMKKEYESRMEAQSSATQALQEEICTLKVAIAYAEEQHRNVLAHAALQAEEKLTRRLAAQEVTHEQQLATAHAVADRYVQETVAKWQQRCHAEKEAAHAIKMDELAQLSRSHAAAMAQCQHRHAEEVAALEASVMRLQECVEQQRIAAESQQASHVSRMAEALHKLASKDTALELAAEQHREEIKRITAEAEGRMQTLATEHASHIEDMQKLHKTALLEQQIEAEARMEELDDQLAALKQRFHARESRREDIEKIRSLAQVVADRDASILKLQVDLDKMESKLEQLHREMILREENYTKVFANGGAGLRVPDVRQALNTQQNVVDWMIKQPPSQSQRNTRK
ncbi:hypothetical protein COCOBI_02-3880 [Coccomyxa sp. Obi]|nr:hypothetical protein COCOBI_02-3880 [Coccomyxa sp. Obi]